MAPKQLAQPHLLALLLPLFLLSCVWVWVSDAQCSPCPTHGGPMFIQGDTVYLDLDVRFRGTTIETQVKAGLTEWHEANRNNGSGVTFDTSKTLNQIPQGATILHVSSAAFTNDLGLPERNTRARFTVVRSSGLHILEATILFNTNALADPLAFNLTPYYDPNSAGYDTIFKKVTMHETGHGMGLNHPLADCQQARASVMNQSVPCPDDAPNDVCNQLPTTVTDCDQ
jgi:hypothetical protein